MDSSSNNRKVRTQYRSGGRTNRRADIKLSAGTTPVRLESDNEGIGDGRVVDVLSSCVTQIRGNVTKEVVVRCVMNLNYTCVSDLDGGLGLGEGMLWRAQTGVPRIKTTLEGAGQCATATRTRHVAGQDSLQEDPCEGALHWSDLEHRARDAQESRAWRAHLFRIPFLNRGRRQGVGAPTTAVTRAARTEIKAKNPVVRD